VLHLTALGTLRCTFNGTPTGIPRQRVRCALLILLACERQVPRRRAAALLWPDSDSKSARHVLSQTLYALRRDFGSDWLQLDDEWIRATDRLTIDVQSFENVARAGAYRFALQLYQGPFLADFTLRSEPWNAWVEAERRRLDGLHRHITAMLAAQSGRQAPAKATFAGSSHPRPRLRAATAAVVALITLVFHAATPRLTPAAVSPRHGAVYMPLEAHAEAANRDGHVFPPRACPLEDSTFRALIANPHRCRLCR